MWLTWYDCTDWAASRRRSRSCLRCALRASFGTINAVSLLLSSLSALCLLPTFLFPVVPVCVIYPIISSGRSGTYRTASHFVTHRSRIPLSCSVIILYDANCGVDIRRIRGTLLARHLRLMICKRAFEGSCRLPTLLLPRERVMTLDPHAPVSSEPEYGE